MASVKHGFVFFALVLCLALAGAWAQAPESCVIENDLVRWEIGGDGLNRHFVDKTSGQDYLPAAPPAAFAAIKQAGAAQPCTKATLQGDKLELGFGDKAGAQIQVKIMPRFLNLKVVSVTGDNVEELTFFDAPLSLKGNLDEPFAACALAFNLQTNVPEVPGPNSRLHALCYPKFGMVGAEAAILACPMPVLRDVMKEAVGTATELPKSNIGGPWALDAEINRGSYLFDFGALTEETVDDWVKTVKTLGLNQIDFHTGTSLRFGDCEPDPKLFPRGRASVKAVLDKLHAAGISAGLHTYAFFIAKNAKYVTPVPDPRLGKDMTLTLTEALTADAPAVTVNESTADMSLITGFFVHNSITIQIDDELITYTGINKEAPFGFTGCQRGAYGTTAAAHAAGAKAYHLKECFGLFTPDADSTLLSEVAANTANTFNECGFDMIYLDALDGEAILGGADQAWHYGSKFVFEIANRLNKPALFEMSTFHHHLWYVRARMGAWDHPCRSHKGFVDVHVAANNAGAGMFLPMNLGWWSVLTWKEGANALWNEPTYSDDIEYLMGKCLATNSGVSLMGVNPEMLEAVPAYQQLAPIFKQYEDLRHGGKVPESILKRLAKPGEELTLSESADGQPVFRPVRYDKHKVQGLEDGSNQWTVKNSFGPQPVRVRIEALYAAAAYDSPDAQVIEDFSQPAGYGEHAAQPGVRASLENAADPVKTGTVSGKFTGFSDRPNPDGAWASVAKTFDPPLNLSGKEALGLWIYGDGQGELLNLQMRSPSHTTSLGYGDHYAVIDFTGWRYVELLELEGGHIAEHNWPYRDSAYAVYREGIDYGQVSRFSFWYNNLPQGKEATCFLSPIKALPLVEATLKNPGITLGGKTLTFPVKMTTGSYLEYQGEGKCILYGPKGEVLEKVAPKGGAFEIQPGDNQLRFDCEPVAGLNARAYVTVISQGDPVTE